MLNRVEKTTECEIHGSQRGLEVCKSTPGRRPSSPNAVHSRPATYVSSTPLSAPVLAAAARKNDRV